MKILHLISSAGCYGAETMLSNLAAALNKLGCGVQVGVFRNAHRPHTEVAEYATKRGIPVAIIPCGGRADWKTVQTIQRHVLDHGIDVLHTHGYKADIYGYFAARALAVPVVATCHNWTGESVSVRLYGMADRMVLRRFQKVVAVSENVAAQLRRAGVARGNIGVIGNGVDVALFQAATAKYAEEIQKDGRIAVGMIGRLVEEKGPQHLLAAAGALKERYANSIYVFVGDGPQRPALERTARAMGMGERVIFAGYRSDVPEVLASLDAVVLPSRREAMPMSVMEAMAAGKPVLATRVGAIPGMISDGHNGLLVDAGEQAQLEGGLARLLEDSNLRRHLGRNAQRWAAEHVSLEATANQYLGIYEGLIKGERKVA